MKEVLIATQNQGKFQEIKEHLKDFNLELLSLSELELSDDGLKENGETYRENALIKARFFYEKAAKAVIADDSGIVVSALAGELGVKTRRWGAGPDVSDERWLEHFLKRMETEDDRRAKFISCICFFDGKDARYFEGACEGTLEYEAKVPIVPGVPLSSIFVPNGYDRVHSGMTLEEKNLVSHRGQALRGLCKFFAEEYSGSDV